MIEIEINDIVFRLSRIDQTASVIKSAQTSGDVIIPNSILYESQSYMVLTISENAFRKNGSIKSVGFCLDPKIQIIQKNAFVDCSINKLFIAESLIELKDGWCNSIKNLNSIVISPKNYFFIYYDDKIILRKSDLNFENYDTVIFARRDLESVIIPSFVKHISPYCFSLCKKLKSIELLDDSQIISIGEFAFADSSIQNVKIPDSIRYFGEGWCKNTSQLKKIQVFNTNKNENFIQSIESQRIIVKKEKYDGPYSILIYCHNKTKKILIPDFITTISPYCFFQFKNLSIVDFTQLSNLGEIKKYSFSESSLTSIKIPSHVKKIEEFAFFNCKKLKKIDFSDNSELAIIENNAFNGTSIENIEVTSHVEIIKEFAFFNCKKLKKIDFSDNSELIEISKKAFSGTAIEYIKIPSHVKIIHDSAFDNCRNLEKIEIPEDLNFNIYKNVLYSKFTFNVKLNEHQYGFIIQNAGILSFLCHYECSLDNVIKKLELPEKFNIFSSFKKKFSISLNDYFCYMNKFDIFTLHPSIGMMCAYRITEQNLILNDMYLELLSQNNCSSFEFYFIRKHSNPNSFLYTFKSFCNFNGNNQINMNNWKLSQVISEHKKKNLLFFEYVKEINDSYPEKFKDIPLLKQLAVNNNLSLVFLCGKSFIEKPGIYSFHLHGTMMPCVRDFNTGFICFDDENKEQFPENFGHLLEYLLKNNPLYKNVEELSKDNVEFTRKLIDKVGASSGLVIETENEIDKTPGSKKKNGEIFVGVSSKTDGSTIQLTFEIAIASLFPVLFPNGPLKEIPGTTLRKKVQNLLLSSKRYRCGPVAANLILFCFDLIEKDENYYFQTFVKPKQLVTVPNNYNRSIPINSLIRKADPSFGLYWHIQLESINGFCEIFGNPDLMMTLTFGNNWQECSSIIEDIKNDLPEYQNSNLGMTYCGVESMFIFEERLSKIKFNKFEKFLNYCNLPKCKHFVCRLEFQNRGAPHVHILMWLERRLSLIDIQSHFYAHIPPNECQFINSIVTTQMLHTCKYPRCFSGKDKSQCKYGFPKRISQVTDYIDGSLIYERSSDETNIVEYNPALINEWGAHAHIHILRCSDVDMPNSNDTCIYVLKYNMKHEPNVTISVNNPDLTWKSLFKGRIVSLEEATARIFSFTFCQKDVITKYVNIQLPEKRKANFDNWKQKTYDDVEAYFLRPSIANDLNILEFYSSFDIKYLKIDADKPLNSKDDNIISKKGRLGNLFYQVHERSSKCIVTFPNYDYSTQREDFLYEYLILNNRYDKELQINDGQSYDIFLSQSDINVINEEVKNSDPYCYFYIKHLIIFERYNVDKVIQKLTNLLSRGISKMYIIESLQSFFEKGLDVIDPDIWINKRIMSILSSFSQYCDAFDQEIDLNNQNHEMQLQKYLHTNYNSDEIMVASTKFDEMYNMLNFEQKECVDTIINDLDVRTPIFISGKAGTGKSFVIECLQNYFIIKKIKFIVTASTGIAAVIIGGKTIHSAFSIFSENNKYVSSLSITNAQGKALAECDVIFVDEVTMANRSIFDLIDRKLKELKAHFHNNKTLLDIPFGGTMLILSGDLGQVPCVVKNSDDMQQFLEMFNNMESFNHFKLCPLKRIMRRNDDSDNFLDILDKIRNYNERVGLEKDVIQLIKSKFIEINDDDDYYQKILNFVGLKGMAIFYKNSSCDNYNNMILKKYAKENECQIYSIRGQLISIKKRSFLSGTTTDNYSISPPNDIDYKLYHAYLSRRESQSLVPFCFKFCIGARVILLKNIDTSNGLVNGRRGEIKEIIFNEITHLPEILVVHFDKISIFEEIDYDITFLKVDTFKKNNGSSFNFYQFPLKLCFAVTSHKCQGQTLDKVAICIDEPAFAHGSFYVAMSRVRCLDDIIFFGKSFPKKGPILHVNNYISDLNFKIDHKIDE